jgi:hypothetical protein
MADLDFYTQNVRFKVDGKPYIGCLDLDALGELQKIWGLTSLADMQKRVENVQLPEMKDIVFVSLLRNQPQITQADGHRIANAMGMNGVVSYVSQVMAAASAPPQATGAGPTRRAKARPRRR